MPNWSKEWLDNHMKKHRGSRICKNCGIQFDVHTTAPEAQHCSQKCAARQVGLVTMKKNRREVENTRYVSKSCQTCGKAFESWLSNDRKYCCQKCASKESAPKGAKTKRDNGWYSSSSPYSRANKGWVTVGGKRFFARSSWEANYSRFLQFKKEHGLIKDWEHEPETFWFKGIKRGCLSYLPDFRIINIDLSIEYHEVKGWMDYKSKVKIRRMAKYHPEIKLVVIDQKKYSAISKSVSGLIPEWSK